MRIYLFIFCFLIGGALLITNTKVEAQTNNPSSPTSTRATSSIDRQGEPRTASSTPRMEERLASSTKRQEDRQELRNERQAALSVVRQQRVLNLSANISNRMEAAITRLYNIVGRLETRIQTLKNNGINTSEAEAKLREAANSLSEARTAIGNIDTLVKEATSSTEPQNRWTKVRETYKTTGEHIRKAHQALRETVSLLKVAVQSKETGVSEAVSQNEAASTTINQ